MRKFNILIFKGIICERIADMPFYYAKKKGGYAMKERLQKLLTVKSIVTIALTGVFCYLSIAGNMSTEFLTIYTTIIAFYFGTQAIKDNDKGSVM